MDTYEHADTCICICIFTGIDVDIPIYVYAKICIYTIRTRLMFGYCL